ncbi:hypothetical protein [Dactylosporangium matsuzakiense]|uniref:Uncharacterized protein n=1 Tax=Dactylosporangium matsuzakiense TaxID=53360 RepID=A0A9W6NTE9_9ACTN|nr:hypothetical protein [Dactylosporangium matsuzakiense]UWZ41168.1 hypothetical protein Dmats_26040 [Dactylosporangium matsuzakiense]GLL08503.1 hypothetical protein GCM10017581_102700 [Dactylosporangium matsuzakiense]
MGTDDDVKHVMRRITPDTGVPTQVDIKSLENAAPWLDDLRAYVHDHLVKQVAVMVMNGADVKLFFGGLEGAADMSKQHNDYMRAMISSYQDIAHALDVASKATKQIAQNYRDAEHNNELNVKAVEKAFTSDSSAGGPASDAGTI